MRKSRQELLEITKRFIEKNGGFKSRKERKTPYHTETIICENGKTYIWSIKNGITTLLIDNKEYVMER